MLSAADGVPTCVENAGNDVTLVKIVGVVGVVTFAIGVFKFK